MSVRQLGLHWSAGWLCHSWPFSLDVYQLNLTDWQQWALGIECARIKGLPPLTKWGIWQPSVTEAMPILVHSLPSCYSCALQCWPLSSALLASCLFLHMVSDFLLHLQVAQTPVLCIFLLCIWGLFPINLLIKQTQIPEVSCSAVVARVWDRHSAARWVLYECSLAVESYCGSVIPICCQTLLWQQVKVLHGKDIGAGIEIIQHCHSSELYTWHQLQN